MFLKSIFMNVKNFYNLTFELKVDVHTHLLEESRKVVFYLRWLWRQAAASS